MLKDWWLNVMADLAEDQQAWGLQDNESSIGSVCLISNQVIRNAGLWSLLMIQLLFSSALGAFIV